MVHFMVLEDNLVQASLLKEIIDNSFKDIQITICSSILMAKQHIQQSTEKFDIFLLDIKMPDGDGIEFATWTRTIKGYSLTPIIFITGYDVYVLPAINLAHCYGYLLKPYHSEELVTMICELMTQFIQNPVAEVDFMTIAKKGLNYRIELKDILYIEIIMKNIDVRTKDKVYKLSRLSLKKIMEQLPAGTFLQCHRSIVVNINCIVKYESRSKDAYVVLNNGEQLPVGNKYRSVVGSLIKQSNR